MRGVDVHHRGIRPARGAFDRNDAGDRLAIALQQVDLERPGSGRCHALVLEVVDLDEGVMPVPADQLALPAQQIERGGILVRVQFVGRGDAQFRLVVHQIKRRVGHVDRSVIGLHAPRVRLAVGQVLLFEDHRPRARRTVAEHFGAIHQHVGPPHVGRAVMLAVDKVPRRFLESIVDLRPARDQVGVDLLNPLADDHPQRRVSRSGDKIEPALVHQRDHLVRSVRRFHVHLAAGGRFEFRDPVELGHGFSAFDIAGPGDDADLAFACAEFRQHVGHDRLGCYDER